VASTPTGPWGSVSQTSLNAISYWLAHAVGADFLAIDGSDVTTDNQVVGGPLVSTEKYAAVDNWLRARTALPIWWMESHVQPVDSGWSATQAAAVRVAALLEMAASGATVGLQWQPQQQVGWPDLGLWTSTLAAGGGQPTVLASDMQRVLPVLQGGISALSNPSPGLLVASGPFGSVAINTTSAPIAGSANGHVVSMAPNHITVSAVS
jgi:hypothetical protein